MFRPTLVAATAIASALSLAACGGDGDAGGTAVDGAPGTEDAIEEYPVEEVTFLVPFKAGSGPDASARVIATQLEEELGASFVVQNVEGGQGLIGLSEIARADADGSTIGWGARGPIAISSHLIDNSPFQGIETLTPIAQTKAVPNVLFASPGKGWDSIEDFVEEAKAKPGELSVGVPEPGSSQAIQFGLLMEQADIDVQMVNYGAGGMILPAVNETVDASVAQIGPVVQYVEAGDLEFIATLGGNAPEGLEVESADDAGYNTADYQGWEGVFGPAGMDEPLVEMLSEAIETAVDSEQYQEFMATTYGLPEFVGHEEFAEKAQQAYEQGPEIIEQFDLAGS